MARGQDSQDVGISWGASGRSHASRSEEEFLDSGALLITRGRFGDLSSEDEEFENANRAPTELPAVSSAPVSVPGRPARLRLLKECHKSPQKFLRWRQCSPVDRQGTRIEMTVEDSDDKDEEWDPDIRVFDPVESDDDSVLDAFQRDLEGDVGPRSKFENDVSPSFQCAHPTCGATQLLRM